MIQDIHPHQLDFGFKQTSPKDGDYVVALRDGRVLLSGDPGGGFLPRYAEFMVAYPDVRENLTYLFSMDGEAFHLSLCVLEETKTFHYEDVQLFRDYQPSWLAFAGATACHLALWYAHNRYCGSCGSPTVRKDNERAVACGQCGTVLYPRISPAVIVAVVHGDQLLLTRYANRQYRRMALVAGFMEVGETLEDTVRREVMEEVGVRVKNVRYYKSQPWAFSGSILAGFFADLDGSPEITVDTSELEEALWVRREDIPPADSTISLTSEMMEVFRLNRPDAIR